MDEYTLEEFMTLCDELAEEDPEFSTLVADGFDKAIIGAGQICGSMTVSTTWRGSTTSWSRWA